MEQAESPLEKKLRHLEVRLTKTSIAGAALTFVVLFIFWLINVVEDHKKGVGFSARNMNSLNVARFFWMESSVAKR
jgi:hypothetical protein